MEGVRRMTMRVVMVLLMVMVGVVMRCGRGARTRTGGLVVFVLCSNDRRVGATAALGPMQTTVFAVVAVRRVVRAFAGGLGRGRVVAVCGRVGAATLWVEEPEGVFGIADEEVRASNDDCTGKTVNQTSGPRRKTAQRNSRLRTASAFSPLSLTSSHAPLAKSVPPSPSPRPSNRSTRSPPAAKKCVR